MPSPPDKIYKTNAIQGAISWGSRPVRDDLGELLFSFVIIADTHVDLEDGPSSSPFPVNRFTNQRTRYCVEDIGRLSAELGEFAPRFVLHLGDLVHPVPSMPSYAEAADQFHAIMSRLEVPFYLLPGNHDVGDKPVDWAPAGVVRDEFLSLWNNHFGADYQCIRENGFRFLLLNAQIINSGLRREGEQREWLESQLADAVEERVFVGIHYPPYICNQDESEHYDNIGEPGRSWLLDLLSKYSVEALFAGHVHHFWYNRHGETDCYLMPSTSFTRQDYSEMFRIAPTPEMQDGRNDVDKTGYFVVFVYENGHVCHMRRTGGAMLGVKDHFPAAVPRIAPIHPRESRGPGLGVDMRHPWAETISIAPSGALDEFQRKEVRNDYPLLALWNMGIRDLRIPAADILNTSLCSRLEALQSKGHRISVISHGVPGEKILNALKRHKTLVEQWDLALPAREFEHGIRLLAEAKRETGIPVYLSKLRMKSDVVREGEPYFHLISHGFVPNDLEEIQTLVDMPDFATAVDGLVFRCGRDEGLWERAMAVDDIVGEFGLGASITMFMADTNPAMHRVDDNANAARVAEALFVAHAFPAMKVGTDTFMDLDRGHSVRTGLIDRFCNPRLASMVVRHLQPILARMENSEFRLLTCDSRARAFMGTGGDSNLILVLPDAESKPTDIAGGIDISGGPWWRVDLRHGQLSEGIDLATPGMEIASGRPMLEPYVLIQSSQE